MQMTAAQADLIARLQQHWQQVEPGKKYVVERLQPGDGQGVAQLFYTIYGDRYPVKDYYSPERIEQMNREGSLSTIVARLETGVVAGQGAYFQSSPPNKALYEGGQLMVAPEYRHSLMAAKIAREMNRTSHAMPQAQGFYGEAVCTHLVTQKLNDSHGYAECGLEVSLMPAGAYENEGAGSQRVSCLMSFRVDQDRHLPLHLPACYRETWELVLGGGALDRECAIVAADTPAAGQTVLERRTFDFAQVERVQVLTVGADFPVLAAQLDHEAQARNLAVLQVFINAGAPGTAFAVETLRTRGFFLGGFLPIWFGPDGVLMQKLFVAPEFETINLHSAKAKILFEQVRADHARTCA
ncbi:acyl carrier protein [Megalodesulfovibrio paquesii]